MGHPISEHVPRITTNRDAPVNGVYRSKYINTESFETGSSHYEMMEPIMEIKGNEEYDESMHGRGKMKQLIYKQFHFMVY